jgi:hypothetical protein
MALHQANFNRIQDLWPHISRVDYNEEDYASFWGCVERKLKIFERNTHDLYPLTLDDIFWLVRELRRQKESTRQSILDTAKEHFAGKGPSDTVISQSVNLAAGLWLNVKIQSRSLEPSSGWLQWNRNQSLVDLLNRSFETVADPETGKEETVNDELTMEKLVTDYGFTVLWTSNLVDHLSLNKAARLVKIYEHKICLRNHQLAGDQTALPQSVVLEAIDTLNLLFPLGEGPTKLLLSKQRKTFAQLGYCSRVRCLRLDNYRIWRDKLEALSMVLDTEPVGMRQFFLWRSGKNALQFATFWIATIVAILTIVSFVTGVMSIMYARKAYDIAVTQYQLSLAEVCADSELAAKLVGWCPKALAFH